MACGGGRSSGNRDICVPLHLVSCRPERVAAHGGWEPERRARAPVPISTKVLPRATTWPGPGTAGAGFNVREKIRKRPNHYTVTGPVLLLVFVKSLRFSLRRDH